MITVLFFGPVAERVGASRLEVGHMRRDALVRPAGAIAATLSASLRDRFASPRSTASRCATVRWSLSDCSEVVFMSKFSGG
jgi:molybdopterin converting factor small subunit